MILYIYPPPLIPPGGFFNTINRTKDRLSSNPRHRRLHRTFPSPPPPSKLKIISLKST